MSEISAKIVADSISPQGKRITTFELDYPRFIHSELMTHRVFSRNAMSSRAIPVKSIIKKIKECPAKPIHYGKNQSGMQAKEELGGVELDAVKDFWIQAADQATEIASYMSYAGAHKQVVNRILEPFQTMKTVLTATEFENFFWLRNHEDAQPEIKKLAEEMLKSMEGNKPIPLLPGEWHLPYYKNGVWKPFVENANVDHPLSGEGFSLKDAIAISASCCAQVSYRKLDDSLEKALKVYERLVESEPVHASPFEHQATPMTEPYNEQWHTDAPRWQEGVTHVDIVGNFWSGNFCGWIQHRQLIANNVKKG